MGYLEERQKEAEVEEGDIKYYLDETDTLCVPKYTMDEVVIKTL